MYQLSKMRRQALFYWHRSPAARNPKMQYPPGRGAPLSSPPAMTDTVAGTAFAFAVGAGIISGFRLRMARDAMPAGELERSGLRIGYERDTEEQRR